MDFTKLCIPKHIKKQIDDNIKDGLQVCTRLPPEPSGGGLHLGHLFAGRLNQTVAMHYGGKFLVRFDDTNPNSECEDYEKAIIDDLIDCGFDLTNLSYTSDSFEFLIQKATELITRGYAYVDNSTQEEIAKQRKDLVSSKCRELSIEANLELWQNMIDGSVTNMSLRLKAFPDSKNGAMRDPVLYRSLDVPHHRTGTKFKIYPTYDFACPILDSVDNVTHIFRSKEYCERDDQMKFILSKLDLRIPKAITYGRIGIEGSELSKRKIKEGIRNGVYTGWDDKKLFTYKGMKNRGISLEGLNKLLDDIGYPESTIEIQQQKIFTINTKVIDKIATRLIAIEESDCMKIDVEIASDISKQIPNFIGNKSLGARQVTMPPNIIISQKEKSEFTEGEEITVIYMGNVIYNNIESKSTLIPHFTGDPSKTSKKILWLNPENIIPITCEQLDGSFKHMITESHITNLRDRDYIQLNKIGYYYKKTNSDGSIMLVQM